MSKPLLKNIIAGVLLIAAILQYPLLHSDAEGLLGALVISAYASLGFIVWAILAFVFLLQMIQYRSLRPPSATRFQMISITLSPIIGLASFLLLTDECDIHDLEKNYIARRENIHAAKLFANSITPSGFWTYVAFNKNHTIDFRVGVPAPDRHHFDILLFEEWGLDYQHYEERPWTRYDSTTSAPKIHSLDSVLSLLHWNRATFEQIQTHLNDANCISVRTGDPTEIGYRPCGMGVYFYVIPDSSFSVESRKHWNDSLQYVLYSDSLAFRYVGGAFGPQTFPDFPRRTGY